MKIKWRPIPDFPAYEASSLGDIRRIKASAGAVVGRVLKPYAHPKLEYLYVLLYDSNGFPKNRGVHTLVLSAFKGKRPIGDYQSAHTDGNRKNNKPSNLRWATRKENMSDRNLHGRTRRGTKHPAAKLTEKDVIQIRRFYALCSDIGEVRRLSNAFGVSEAQISRIVHNKNWTHLVASTTAE